MMRTTDISRWLTFGDLEVYEVEGNRLFPLYGANGGITARFMAFVARNRADFPDNDFGMDEGLDASGKYYRLVFAGNHSWSRSEVDAKLREAEKALA